MSASSRLALGAVLAGLALLGGFAESHAQVDAVQFRVPSVTPDSEPDRGAPTRDRAGMPGHVRPPEMVIGPHAPVFIQPFVQTVAVSDVSAVQIGLSGWIVPAVVFDRPYTTGGAALGLTFTWGLSIEESRGDRSP